MADRGTLLNTNVVRCCLVSLNGEGREYPVFACYHYEAARKARREVLRLYDARNKENRFA
jgi:hypothetical protein